MSPTCPITTWSPSRQTFWTESPLGPILPQPLTAGSAAVHCTSSRPRLDGACGHQGWRCCQAHAAARTCEACQGLQQAGVRFQSPVQPAAAAAAAEGSSLSAPHLGPLLHSWDALHTMPVCGEATSACRTSNARAGCPGPYWFLLSCYCFLERRLPLRPVAQGCPAPSLPIIPHMTSAQNNPVTFC